MYGKTHSIILKLLFPITLSYHITGISVILYFFLCAFTNNCNPNVGPFFLKNDLILKINKIIFKKLCIF